MIISRNKKVRFQYDISIANFNSLNDAISEKGDKIHEIFPIAVLSNFGELYELNLVAALYWESIENSASFDDIVKAIGKFFEIDVNLLVSDLKDLTDDLQNEGLVNVA